jgi:cytochrome c peroxidase
LKIYNLDTGTGLDTGKAFDTPTLIELWRTAPYLHDGRAETIVDVLKKHNPNDKHGRTSDLTDKQVRELAEFMLSL